MLKNIMKAIIDYAIEARIRRERDLQTRLSTIATNTTLDYINKNLPDTLILRTDWSGLADYVFPKIKTSGSILEFGVWVGTSINHTAKKLPDKIIHGFDSFEGLPEDWGGHFMPKNTFDLKGKLPKVRKNVKLHKGWFEDTLPQFLEENKEDIAFMNMDADIYSSTYTVLELLHARIKKGTIIIFDEYFNSLNWKQHEYKAFQEFIIKHDAKYEYLAYTSSGGCVAIRITDISKG